MQPAVDLVVACLRAHGARRVFGDPLGDLDRVAVDDPALAALLADADGRLGGVGVAFSSATRSLRLSSTFAARAEPLHCDSPLHIVRTVEIAARAAQRSHTTAVVTLDFDLDTPVTSAARPAGSRDYVPYAGALVDPSARLAVLAGPEVLRRRAGAAVHAFAAKANCGVANTWGAKGLFVWDSPHHMGTVGLQARDFELVFDQVDLVLATGIDPDEARPPMPATVEVVTVDPQQLASLAAHVEPRAAIAPNALYGALAAIAQPGYSDERFPFHPARLVAQLRADATPGALLVAEPGPVGFWVARTFSTTEPGSVIVPARGAPGCAAAVAAAAAISGRAATVAVSGEDATRDEVLAWSAARGTPVSVAVWDSPDTPVDWSANDDIVAAAGPIVAF